MLQIERAPSEKQIGIKLMSAVDVYTFLKKHIADAQITNAGYYRGSFFSLSLTPEHTLMIAVVIVITFE